MRNILGHKSPLPIRFLLQKGEYFHFWFRNISFAKHNYHGFLYIFYSLTFEKLIIIFVVFHLRFFLCVPLLFLLLKCYSGFQKVLVSLALFLCYFSFSTIFSDDDIFDVEENTTDRHIIYKLYQTCNVLEII